MLADLLNHLLPCSLLAHDLSSKPEQVLLVRMCLSLESLQSGQSLIPQPVLREHAPDGLPEHLSTTLLLHQGVHSQRLQGTGSRGVSVVGLLPLLAAGNVQSRAIGNHDVVTAVGRRVEGGLVFAHQEHGDA